MPLYPVSNVVKRELKRLTLCKQIDRFHWFNVCKPAYTSKIKTLNFKTFNTDTKPRHIISIYVHAVAKTM